jgi:hypothetical protein
MCDHDGPDWKDIAISAALAEEMADEERERLRAQKEVEKAQEEDEE